MLGLEQVKQLVQGIPPNTVINTEYQNVYEGATTLYVLLKYPHLRQYFTGQCHPLDFIRMVYDQQVPSEAPYLVLRTISLEDFPIPSLDAIMEADATWAADDWKDYMITAWCLLGGYQLPNLRYFQNHIKLADLVGVRIDPSAIDYSSRVGKQKIATNSLLYEDPSLNNVFGFAMRGFRLHVDVRSFMDEYYCYHAR